MWWFIPAARGKTRAKTPPYGPTLQAFPPAGASSAAFLCTDPRPRLEPQYIACYAPRFRHPPGNPMSPTVQVSDRRDTLSRRGRRLEYFTLGWNLIEAAVAGAAGLAAGSTALIGFGLDSLVESLSGGVLLWRLRDGEAGEARERVAQRLVAVSFVALAAYVGTESILTLSRRAEPESSLVGIGLAAVSLLVMPVLARAKRRVAAGLGSAALTADSRQTDLCAYLSAILLIGLGLNALFGWWWADPAAALAMTPIMGFEARRSWRGDTCEC